MRSWICGTRLDLLCLISEKWFHQIPYSRLPSGETPPWYITTRKTYSMSSSFHTTFMCWGTITSRHNSALIDFVHKHGVPLYQGEDPLKWIVIPTHSWSDSDFFCIYFCRQFPQKLIGCVPGRAPWPPFGRCYWLACKSQPPLMFLAQLTKSAGISSPSSMGMAMVLWTWRNWGIVRKRESSQWNVFWYWRKFVCQEAPACNFQLEKLTYVMSKLDRDGSGSMDLKEFQLVFAGKNHRNMIRSPILPVI